MRFITICLCWVVAAGLGQFANGQDVRLFMALDGEEASAPMTGNTTIIMAPGTSTLVSVWLDDTVSADLLNFYQVIMRWEATPMGGALGLVSYVDDGVLGGNSVLIDIERADFVFAGEFIGPPFYTEVAPPPVDTTGFGFISNLASLAAGVTVNGIAYVGHFELSASGDACGIHELAFVNPGAQPQGGTSMGGPNGLVPYPLDPTSLERQSLSIDLGACAGCVDPCDDGDPCTDNDTCVDGTCVGQAVDCSGAGDACNDASCDSAGAEGNCDTLTPVADGSACDDGDSCTLQDTCQAGSCASGDAPDCSGAGDACNDASCDSAGAEGNCDTLTPVADGSACDDGDSCTLQDTCQAGSCASGDAPDCSGAGDDCNDASCDSAGAEGNCDSLTPANDGASCDGGAGVCAGGTCEPAVAADVRLFMAAHDEQGSAPNVGNTTLTLDPGETRRVGVWFDDTVQTTQLNFYQVIMRWQAEPQVDATGIVDYVDDGAPNGGSVLLDPAHADFVFGTEFTNPPFYNETSPPPTESAGFGFIGSLSSLNAGVDVTGIKYIGEFDIQASADACGDHVLHFVGSGELPAGGTSAGAPGGLMQYPIDLVQSLTITVNCEACEDPCDDGDSCTENDACVDGVCVGAPMDCSDGDLCTEDLCADGVCSNPDVECARRGTVCDPADGQCKECLSDGMCSDGEACTMDSCVDGVCTFTPLDDGSTCSDAEACTVDDTCQAGVCISGDAPDCSGFGDVCNTASCNSAGAEGNCDTLTPLADGSVCTDDSPCTISDTCQAGVCVAGDAPDCSGAGDACNEASCDPAGALGNCDVLTPELDGTGCDDGDACSTNDSCEAGVCGGTPTDCSSAGDECNDASCDAGGADGNCDTLTPVADGTLCNAGEGVCAAGVCEPAGEVATRLFVAADGEESTVPSIGNTTVTVDPGGTRRVSVWIEDTVQTTQLNFYQIILRWDAVAQAGATGTVNYVDDGAPNGESVLIDTMRPDFVFGTEFINPPFYNETSPPPSETAGFGFIGSLSALNAGVDVVGIRYVGEFEIEASADACGAHVLAFVDAGGMPAGGTSAGAPGGLTQYVFDAIQSLTVIVDCDVCEDPCTDDDPCTINDQCIDGTCTGEPVDCSLSGDDCNAASCDPSGAEGNCDVLTPLADGTACDDGDACSVDDACAAGACQGTAPDCSGAGDDCNDASCDPAGASGNCDILTPVADGAVCDDGDICSIDDACAAGDCQGTQPDCSGAGDECNDASCDSAGADGNCDTLTTLPDGTPCDGGAGMCAAGVCEPVGAVSTRLFAAADGEEGEAPAFGNTTVVVDPGTSRQVAMWIEDTVQTTQLNFYQVIMRWDGVPQAGATGAVAYVEDGMPNGGSVLIDSSRDDFVFSGAFTNPPFYNESGPPPSETAGFGAIGSLSALNDGVDVVGIRYIAEFAVEATADACGEHVLTFVPNGGMPAGGTSAGAPGGLTPYPIELTQSLTIFVDCGLCEEPCTDEDSCTIDDQCVDNECVGTAVDCSGLDTECALGSCDPSGADGNCDATIPTNEGQPCNDGEGVCMGGSCQAPGCPIGAVEWIDPPNGVIDARQPHPVGSLEPMQGISTLLVEAPAGATIDCWFLCETSDGGFGPNDVESVIDNGDGTYTLVLIRPITPGAVTTVTLGDLDCQAGVFTFHPGNVNRDEESSPLDILALIDVLNGVVEPSWGHYSADLNHRGIISPLDILVLIDLLNGADFHVPWQGTQRPENTCDQCNACTADEQCDDGNPCTTGVCDMNRGGCVYENNEGPCDDGSACSTDDVCVDGICTGTMVNCDDGNECTSDECDPLQGCMNEPGNDPCDDGDACTIKDVCTEGSCAGQPMTCADAETCTVDACADGVCTHTDILELAIECEDGPEGDAFCQAQGAPSAVCEDGLCVCTEGNNLNPPGSLCLDLRGAGEGNQEGHCSTDFDCTLAAPSPDGILQCSDNDFEPNNGGICVDQACYALGETIVVDLEIGRTDEAACGAQVFLEWDVAFMELVELQPDPDGELSWTQVFVDTIDDVAGTIDLAMGIPIGVVCNNANGTYEGGTLVRLTFTAIQECKAFGVRFRPHNPVSGIGGANGQMPLTGCDGDADPSSTGEISVNESEAQWDCPSSSSGPADPGGVTREVLFAPVAVVDACDAIEMSVGSLCTIEYFLACGDDLDCGRGEMCATDSDCDDTCVANQKADGFLCDGAPCVGFCRLDVCENGTCAAPSIPEGVDLDAYLDGGGDFLPGRTEIRCSYENTCGIPSGCEADIRNSVP
jgi:hypothetical protein